MSGDASSSDYTDRLKEAVRSMIRVRDEKGVRPDSHLQALGDLVRDIFVTEGFDEDDVLVNSQDEAEKKRRRKRRKTLTLPGYFRATKNWDLLVVEQDILVAAVEFKTQSTSAAKNVNNRVEEVLGSGTDFWEAKDAGYLGLVRPWLGYFLILEHSAELTRPVKTRRAYFPFDGVFENASYVGRYEVLCKRLVDKELYDAACLIVATKDTDDPFYEPSTELGINQFAAAIKERAQQFEELRRRIGRPRQGRESRLF